MKKLLSLLLTLTLLCGAASPALAELGAVGAQITYADYAAALGTLTREYLGWEMEWNETEIDAGFVYGNMRMSPVLVLEGEYVAVAYVSFTIETPEEAEDLIDLFLIVCTLVAATPAVAAGADPDTAVNDAFAELSAMLGSLSGENPTMMALVGGNSCGVTLSQDDSGVTLNMFLTYQTPGSN